jgi:hypothetical protein
MQINLEVDFYLNEEVILSSFFLKIESTEENLNNNQLLNKN